MTLDQNPSIDASTSYKNVPTRATTAGGVDFAYRELGPHTGTPVIFLTHLAANLDNWDPRVVNGTATKHRVITFDNRGVGASSGKVPDTVEAMANDAVMFIRALGFQQVDILGFSLGGMIAQVIALEEPQLVRKLILTGTGPAGGEAIDKVTRISSLDLARGLLTLGDPQTFLFFTRTANGKRSAKEFLARLKERTEHRDNAMSLTGYRAQLKAIHRWGRQEPADLSVIAQPVLVANGDHDRMVPTTNTVDLDRRLPNSELVIYPDAGHGGIFQQHREFVATALEFLDRQQATPRTEGRDVPRIARSSWEAGSGLGADVANVEWLGTFAADHDVMGPGPSGTTMAITNNPGKETRVLCRRINEVHANMQQTVEGVKHLAEETR